MNRMANGKIGKNDRGADGDSWTGIGTAHDRLHVIATSVEMADRLIFAIKHLRVLVGEKSRRRAKVPGVKPHRVERWGLNPTQCGIGLMRGIAVDLVIWCRTAPEL